MYDPILFGTMKNVYGLAKSTSKERVLMMHNLLIANYGLELIEKGRLSQRFGVKQAADLTFSDLLDHNGDMMEMVKQLENERNPAIDN